METIKKWAQILFIAAVVLPVFRQDFPTITLGSRIIVPRDKFMAWIDEQSSKKTEIF